MFHIYIYPTNEYCAIPSKNAVSTNIKMMDTSIKHAISGQSTPMVKVCMDIDVVDTAFSY